MEEAEKDQIPTGTSAPFQANKNYILTLGDLGQHMVRICATSWNNKITFG